MAVTTIPDDVHNPVTKTATITVNKLKTQINVNAITTTYNINRELVITLTDSQNNPLSGVKLSVNLNGAKTFITDRNGQIKVSTNALVPKSYAAVIAFEGNTNYFPSSKSVKVTVKKAKSKIIDGKKSFKAKVKVKKYTITLKDNVGKFIKKARVSLKVKGKTYKATTNSKGKATFKITKLSKKGKFKGRVTFKGNAYYTKVTKKVKIKVR